MKKYPLPVIIILAVAAIGMAVAESTVEKKQFCSFKADEEGQYITVNGKDYGPYQEIIGGDVSSDGTRWGLLVKKDDKLFLLLNGKETGPLAYERARDFTLSGWCWCNNEIGDNWAFRTSKDDGEYAVINGKEYGPFTNVETLMFSADPNKWFLRGRIDQDGNWGAYIGGKSYGPYRDIREETLSTDGGKWSMIAAKDTGEFAVIDGKEYGPYQWVNRERQAPVFTAETKENQQRMVIIGGKEYGPYQWIGAVYSSPDAGKWAFCYGNKRQQYVMTDATTYGPFEGVDMQVTNDGGEWAFQGKNKGQNTVVVNGKKQNYSNCDRVFMFVAGGNNVAFEATKKVGITETRVVVVNNVEYPGIGLKYVRGKDGEYFVWSLVDAENAYLSRLKIK